MSDVLTSLQSALADRYTIERQLGEGGMATVYLAEDLKHGRKVAIKVLRPELAAVIGAERFVREIRTIAALQHPHILGLIDSGEVTGTAYYVMPYVEGESLRDRLNREKQLPVADAVRIATEVAGALDYAHRHGIIHRDIKPENILLHDGSALVADFGIALAVSSAGGTRMTETGMSLGTPFYMSPEQAMGEREITARSDVYALGAMTYEMLVGDPPFTGSTAQAIVAKVVTETPRPMLPQRHTIPPQVEAAVLTALEKLPADRFASAAEFATALSDTTAPVVTRPGAATTTRPVPARALRPLPWLVAGLALAIALASWILRPRETGAPVLQVELEPPRGVEFAEFRFAALSPDGERLAFIGLGAAGERKLWVRNLRSGQVDSLSGTAGAEAPFWAPDGRAVGFFARGSLMRFDLGGGVSRTLCPVADLGGSWSSRGTIIFTRSGHPMVVPADGGECTVVAGAWRDASRTLSWPAWFPDGRRFAGNDSAGLVWSDINGVAPRALLPGAHFVQLLSPGVAVYSRQGRSGADIVAQRLDLKHAVPQGERVTLARGIRAAGLVPSYTVARNGLVYLQTAQLDEGPLIVDEKGAIRDSISLQGTWTLRAAWRRPAVALAGYGLWVYDLQRRTTVPVRPTGVFMFPVWSPGDSLLAALDGRTGKTILINLQNGADSTIVDQTGRGNSFTPTDWTSDGRYLILVGETPNNERHGALWTLSTATGKLEPLVSVSGTASAGAVSPDGKWLAYVSDETGELEVYLRPFRQGGAVTRVSLAGGGLPRWRRDGHALFFEGPDGSIMQVPVRADPGLQVGSPQALFRSPRWSARLFADQFGGVQATTTYDVGADGHEFLVRQRVEGSPSATLLLNWQQLLGQ